MLEGVVESFITCACADEDSAKCYFYLAVLSAAILAMAIQFGYMLDELNGIFAETDNPVAVVIGLIVSFVQLSLSPMLITKFSSWFILLISVVGDYESKAEFILPAVLIVVNIAMAIVAACVEMSSGLLIAYLSVFGVLSVVSFIAVLKQNDIV
ncbi:MAG: hypothetical protein J1F39_03375 [Clostridiales bacterium]|nr:hypothetical protein [Clostridiales bacterium]